MKIATIKRIILATWITGAIAMEPAITAAATAISSAPSFIVIRVGQLIDGKGGVLKNVAVTIEGSHIKSIINAFNIKNVTYNFPNLTLHRSR